MKDQNQMEKEMKPGTIPISEILKKMKANKVLHFFLSRTKIKKQQFYISTTFCLDFC